MLTLVAALVAHTMIPAKFADGFALTPEGVVSLSTCALETRVDGRELTVRIFSDDKPEQDFRLTDFISLPLKEGVIPTHQAGFSGEYEEGVLSLRKTEEDGFFRHHWTIRLVVDPDLEYPVTADAERWVSTSLPPRRPARQTQRLHCEF